jgi:membrane dipeptidase
MITVREISEAESAEVHRRAVIIDNGVLGFPIAHHVDGGVTATQVTVSALHTPGLDEVMLKIADYLHATYAQPAALIIVSHPDDIRRAKRDGKLGFILAFQGLNHIGDRLYWIEMFARIGVRVMACTYNSTNALGCGAGELTDTGLTYFGRTVVREMNRVGVVVDLSHLGERTAFDAVRVSQEPVVLSHSNPKALVDHGRNASDDLMRAVADSGGVMALSVYAPLLDRCDGQLPTVETLLDHIDYAVNLLGIDHVGIGSDVAPMSDVGWLMYQLQHRELVPDYQSKPPYLGKAVYHSIQGFFTAAEFPQITHGLLQRGASEEDVFKILGGNLLRVYDQAWGSKMASSSPVSSQV